MLASIHHTYTRSALPAQQLMILERHLEEGFTADTGDVWAEGEDWGDGGHHHQLHHPHPLASAGAGGALHHGSRNTRVTGAS